MPDTSMTTHASVDILGLRIDAVNLGQALEHIGNCIAAGEPRYICVAAAHTVMSCRYEQDMREIFNDSSLTAPDGMSLVWLLRLRGQHGVGRVYGGDLLERAAERSVAKGWRLYLYGGEPGVPEALKSGFEHRYPGVQVVGCYSPPFGPLAAPEDDAIVERINSTHPDIVWVGLGTGKQERWIREHLGRVNSPLLIGVGAAFDFVAGTKPQAPYWMQRSGLEWLFRLGTEPRRLWRRYAQYPLFAILVLGQWLGLLHDPVPDQSKL